MTVIPSERLKLAVWLDTTSSCSSATRWKPSPLSMVALAPEVPWISAVFAPSPMRLTIYSVAILAPSTLSEAMAQSTSTPLTTRSTEMTLIPAATASCTAGATASESTGLTMRTLIFLEIRSSISLVCFAASSPASTTIRSAPSSSAFASAPSLRVTKNGLFSVDTEKPMLPFPPLPPSVILPSSPSMVMALQPASENPMTAVSRSAAIFFIFIIALLLSLLAFSVGQHRDQNHDTLYHILVVG